MKIKASKDNLLAISSTVFLFCFLLIAFFRSSLWGVNSAVNMWAATVNSNFFLAPAKVIDSAFQPFVILIVTIVIAITLVFVHHRRYSILMFSSYAGGYLIVNIIKGVIASPRPPNEIIDAGYFSFPSSHVMASVIFFGLLTFIAWKKWKTSLIKVSVSGILYVFLIFLVGFDRIYLNVHWLTDVVGALFLGAFWLTFCLFLFNKANSRLSKTSP